MRHEAFAAAYLESIDVSIGTPATFVFDPGYCPNSLRSHLNQSAHLLCGVKLSMGTWQIASRSSVEEKIKHIRASGLRSIAGGGSFEIAASLEVIPRYLDLCAEAGFDCVEMGEGFAAAIKDPNAIINLATDRGLSVQYELGRKFDGAFKSERDFGSRARDWILAGVDQIVIEAREDAIDVGLFDRQGELNRTMADLVLNSVDGEMRLLQFEAPTKKSQFALIEHFGPTVRLANVRLEEILRVEIFRRGLHSRAFLTENLRPRGSAP